MTHNNKSNTYLLTILFFIQAGAGFSRKHPLSTWMCALVELFAGGMLANLFLGEPILAPLKSNQLILLYTVVWYAFSPKNLVTYLYFLNFV